MSRTTSVALGAHFVDFIDVQVQQGRYGSASDVVRAGLRLLEEHEAKVQMLKKELAQGLASGQPQPLDFEAFKAKKRATFFEK